ncbi:MAG: immunoglobulin domain-containing protein, partial [Prevotella sp.]|nr:immunoglobulin domain-containing protein [Prevotella sp.]
NTVLLEKDLAPEYDIKKGETIECTASGSGSTITYQWYRNGVAMEGETDGKIAPQKPGNYYCTATADGKTVQSSIANVTVDGETGIMNVNGNGNVNANGNGNVNANSNLYNLAGQRVGSGYRGMRVQKGRKMVE